MPKINIFNNSNVYIIMPLILVVMGATLGLGTLISCCKSRK